MITLLKNIFFFSLFIILLTNCNSKENKEVFIIPENFQGKVIVFYQTSSTYKDYKQNHRKIVYNVPYNGVISIPFNVSDITSLEFKDYKANDIKFAEKELDNEKINIADIRKGYLFLESVQVKYTSFYVGKKDFINNLDSIDSEEYLKSKYKSIN
ncbi:hypothetical protein [Chishuiella changwenlii]|uniref:hypothetical protein n=1 Tax=Chishuiella changwenlii TaxID=1434701 RepID=UPI002FDA8621